MQVIRATITYGLLSVFLAIPCHADIVVVVNKSSPVTQLNADQLEKIFLGKLNTFPDGGVAVPLDLPKGPVRDAFYARITGGKNSNQIKAYWSRVVFTSAGQPPREVDSPQETLGLVLRNPSHIGYMERSHANQSVRIVFATQ